MNGRQQLFTVGDEIEFYRRINFKRADCTELIRIYAGNIRHLTRHAKECFLTAPQFTGKGIFCMLCASLPLACFERLILN